MADPYQIVSLGGHAIGPSSGFGAYLDADDRFPVGVTLNTTPRRNAPPTVDSISIDGRVIPMRLVKEASISATTFHQRVQEWCNPAAMVGGPVELVMYAVDGATQISAPVYVVNREPLPGPWVYAVTLYLADTALRATTPTVATSTPIVNAGSVTALPTIEFTSAVHKTRRAATVAGAGYGGGMTAIPVRLDLASTAATSTNVFVFVNGLSVPCAVAGPSTSSSCVFALVDTPADGTATTVSVVYGSGLVNPLCGTLADGGMVWSTSATTGTTNAIWRWDDLRVSANPRKRPGVWYPALTGTHLYDGTTVGWAETATQIDLTLGASGGPLAADSIACVIPPGLSAVGFLTNALKRLTDASFANARFSVRYKVAGDPNWRTAWSTTAASQTITTALAGLADAIIVAIGVESTSAASAPAGTASIAIGTAGTWSLGLANGPTVTVGAAENLDYYDGTFQIGSGPEITFAQFMTLDGTLTFDGDARTIAPSVANAPMYGGLLLSDDGRWPEAAPGSNAITNSTGGAYTVTLKAGYT